MGSKRGALQSHRISGATGLKLRLIRIKGPSQWGGGVVVRGGSTHSCGILGSSGAYFPVCSLRQRTKVGAELKKEQPKREPDVVGGHFGQTGNGEKLPPGGANR